jgi:hypothetical protein
VPILSNRLPERFAVIRSDKPLREQYRGFSGACAQYADRSNEIEDRQ